MYINDVFDDDEYDVNRDGLPDDLNFDEPEEELDPEEEPDPDEDFYDL